MLFDLGLTGPGGMGPAPVSWAEMGEWQRLTGRPLPPWQCRALRQASVEYVAELGKATDPGRPPPWQDDPTEEDRQRVADGLRNAFAARTRG